MSPQAAVTKTCAIDAVAVPLWETAASGGTKDLDVHEYSVPSGRLRGQKS
jgi:hypothetical protein